MIEQIQLLALDPNNHEALANMYGPEVLAEIIKM